MNFDCTYISSYFIWIVCIFYLDCLQKVINGAKISNWACVNFCEDLSKKAIEEFCFKLAEMSRIIGAVICLFTILFNVSRSKLYCLPFFTSISGLC